MDGVFVGPVDLSANMGHPGDHGHRDVQQAIEDSIAHILACGKAPGILTTNDDFARRYIELGCLFTAVGVDMALLARGAEALAKRFKV
ncbi:aldolase/citrate lyase family protein [Candidimonas sp. SYP-B2681]|uniref:aldolase/citrate lyase family protein n=1 Tax=Candidimonas sp. SYP-B2681 TaxID=2497686 RepID=UPI0026993EE8